MTATPEERSDSPAPARRTRIRVRYADTDQMGVAYYANYFVWFEVGRTEWLRETGWSYREMERDGVALPVIAAGCEYRRPVRYDDEVEITTRATLLTPVRIRFDYDVRLDPDLPPAASAGARPLAAVGHTIHAATAASGRPCRLPRRIQELLR